MLKISGGGIGQSPYQILFIFVLLAMTVLGVCAKSRGIHHDDFIIMNDTLTKESSWWDLFSDAQARVDELSKITPMIEHDPTIYYYFFGTTMFSCLTFIAAYVILRTIVIPIVLRLSGQGYCEYFAKSLSPYEQSHHAQVFLSFVHALIATFGSYYCTIHLYGLDLLNFTTQNAFNQPYDKGHFETRQYYIAITLGYFIADLLFYFFNHFHPLSPDIKVERKEMVSIMKKQAMSLELAHHYISCIAYIFFFILNMGSYLIISFEINEISTPFLHIRYYARTWKQTNKWWYQVNQALFAVTFFLSRIVYNGILIAYSLWSYYHVTAYVQAHPVIIGIAYVFPFLYYSVQLMWWIAITKIIVNKFKGGKSKDE